MNGLYRTFLKYLDLFVQKCYGIYKSLDFSKAVWFLLFAKKTKGYYIKNPNNPRYILQIPS